MRSRSNGGTIGAAPIVNGQAGSGVWPTDAEITSKTGWPSPAGVDEFARYVVYHAGDVGYNNHILKDASTNGWDAYTTSRNTNNYGSILTTHAPSNKYWSQVFSQGHYTVADAPTLRLGANDFTIEFWINLGVTSTTTRHVCGKGNTTVGWNVSLLNGKSVAFEWGSGPSRTTSPVALVPSIWTHVAIVRQGTRITIYQNGAQTVTSTPALTTFDDTNPMYVGQGRAADSTARFIGYMSDLRISNVAVYTAPFNAPTAPLATTAQSVYHLSMLSRNLEDFAPIQPQGLTVTNSSDTQRYPIAPFADTDDTQSGSVMVYDGARYIQVHDTQPNNTSLRFGTGPFTIEAWVYFRTSRNASIVRKGTATSGWELHVAGTNTNAKVTFWDGATAREFVAGRTSLFGWHHVAVVRTDTSTDGCAVYLNGKLLGKFTCATNFSGTDSLSIGLNSKTGYSDFAGLMSNVKLSRRAEYTADFTPQPVLTADADTAYLALQHAKPALASFVNRGTDRNITHTATSEVRSYPGPHNCRGYSVYFTATSKTRFEVKRNGNFNFGTGDFAFECFYCSQYPHDTYPRIIFDSRDAVDDAGLVIRTSTFNTFEVQTGTRTLLVSKTAVSDYRWHHLLVQRVNGAIAIYIDGELEDENVYTGSISNPAHVKFGGSLLQPTRGWYGYLSNIHIQRGSSSYAEGTTNPPRIKVPTSTITPVSGTVLLTACGPMMIDYATPATANVLQWDATNAYGGWDAYLVPFSPFDATEYSEDTHIAATAASNTDLINNVEMYARHLYNWMQTGTQSFTIDGWFMPPQTDPATPTQYDLMYTGTTSGHNGFKLVYHSTGTQSAQYGSLNFIQYCGAAGTYSLASPSYTIKSHWWNHFAVVYDATLKDLAVFINGKRVAINGYWYPSTADGITSTDLTIVGPTADIRISKTVRYDTNSTTYTVPTSRSVLDADTVYLVSIEEPFANIAQGLVGTYTFGNITPCYTVKKFGTASIQHQQRQAASSIYDYVYLAPGTWFPHRGLNPRRGDLTVEGWFAWSGSSAPTTGRTLISLHTNGLIVDVDSTGKWRLNWGDGAYTVVTTYTVATAPTFDHIALVRRNLCWTLYVNGVEAAVIPVGTFDLTQNRNDDYVSGEGHLFIKRGGNSTNVWTGYSQDVRITMAARYITRSIGGVPTMVHIDSHYPALPTDLLPR